MADRSRMQRVEDPQPMAYAGAAFISQNARLGGDASGGPEACDVAGQATGEPSAHVPRGT